MAKKNFQIRLDETEIAEIDKRVKEAKLPSHAALARIFIQDGLARFDRKHEHLIEKIDELQSAVDRLSLIAAMSAAGVSFLDLPRIDGKQESGQERVKGNIQGSLKMGRVIKKMADDGSLGRDS